METKLIIDTEKKEIFFFYILINDLIKKIIN
jgi:hypothetical protein